MKRRINQSVVAALGALALLASPGASNKADAYVFLPLPWTYPVADCGTVVQVGSWYDDDDGTGTGGCRAWLADEGGVYTFPGVDNYQLGDRIFVSGDACFDCLSTCQAGVLLTADVSACGG